jgi:hypothetical protein
MPAGASSNKPGPRCLSLEELFQRFPGLAATIAGLLDQGSKKGLRMCSRSCKAAVNPVLTHVGVLEDVGGSLALLQSPNWQHLQELKIRWEYSLLAFQFLVIYNKQWDVCIWGEDGNRGTGECSTAYVHNIGRHTKSGETAPTSPFFCGHNRSYLLRGAVGAQELVKGDWPELQVLNIRWGGPAMPPCFQQRSRNGVRLNYSPHVTARSRAVSTSWMQKLRRTLQLGAGQSCRSSTFSECCMICEAS